MKKKFSNAPIEVYENASYLNYVVEHNGRLQNDINISDKYFVTIIDNNYAIISFPIEDFIKDSLDIRETPFPSIVYVAKYYMYTLQEFSPIEAAKINLLQLQNPLNLIGKGVVVGVIDTGIDYLNKEFINDDGTTRILSLWDQTLPTNIEEEEINVGRIFTKEKINEAITAFKEGKNPYDIVPSKDEIGHGTAMASIIGARGVNKEIKGAAPGCDFVVVKLMEDLTLKKNLDVKVPIYSRAAIMLALNYLYEYAKESNYPMVIYFPLGTSFGNHKGDGLLEQYINQISLNKGIVVVTGSGNEGIAGGHTSGVLSKVELYRDIPINISKEQKNLRVELWVDKPNIFSVDIISSTSKNTGIINAALNKTKISQFVFENTTVSVRYFIPDELTGDELVIIDFFNLTAGVWKIRLYGDYIYNGIYNAWMFQRGLAVGNTMFISNNPFGTFTGPGSAELICTVANYDQNNFYIEPTSGLDFSKVEFRRSVRSSINIAAGGVNVKAAGLNNTTTVVSGTSVSAAVVAGACAILFQWGIVEGNEPAMYSQNVITYLQRGTEKRENDVYPNPEWGYGALDMVGVFKYLK